MPGPTTPPKPKPWWQTAIETLKAASNQPLIPHAQQQAVTPTATSGTGGQYIPWWKRNQNKPPAGTPLTQQQAATVQTPASYDFYDNVPKGSTVRTYDATPPKTPAPTNSFFGGGGAVVRGPKGNGVPSTIPTGSFIGGGGQYVIGPNMQGYYIGGMVPTSSFIGANGEAIAGPAFAVAETQQPSTGFGTSYGGNWKRRGRGGGRGWTDYAKPAWYMNLNSWNPGE